MKVISTTVAMLFLAVGVPGAWAATSMIAPVEGTGFLKDVDVSDGVDEPEARIIAKFYFNKHVGCGTYQAISDSAESWVVEGTVGYSGTPISGFLINKKTGAISSPIGPSYARPSDMLMLGPNNSFKPNPLRGSA